RPPSAPVHPRPAAVPPGPALPVRPAPTRPGHAEGLHDGGGGRHGRCRGGPVRDHRSPPARRPDRTGPRMARRVRLPGHPRLGDRPDPVRRTATPPRRGPPTGGPPAEPPRPERPALATPHALPHPPAPA